MHPVVCSKINKMIERWNKKQHLRVKGRVLNLAVAKNPHVVLDHKILHFGVLVLLVDILHKMPVQLHWASAYQ
jgi:hypothetical protein